MIFVTSFEPKDTVPDPGSRYHYVTNPSSAFVSYLTNRKNPSKTTCNHYKPEVTYTNLEKGLPCKILGFGSE